MTGSILASDTSDRHSVIALQSKTGSPSEPVVTQMTSSPSSSAVTIPIPGKSILKKPPPAPQSLFSRITKFNLSFLPTSPGPASPLSAASSVDGFGFAEELAEREKPLKRAHFILPQLAIVYPISSSNPPSMPGLREEKRSVEEREFERRRRIVRGDSMSTSASEDDNGKPEDDWWTLEKVESFYRECCAGCEEMPDPAVTRALLTSPAHPRSLDLSGVQLTLTSAKILGDILTIEWGLRKLTLKECALDEAILKPILHSLLIPNTLSYLSIAMNRKLTSNSRSVGLGETKETGGAWRLISAYMTKARTVQFLDLSENSIDRRGVEWIVTALPAVPSDDIRTLQSLKLDSCNIRHTALETLARTVRTSGLRNISLRYNKIGASGGVALALMIRDYPDVVPQSPAPGQSPVPSSATLPPLESPTPLGSPRLGQGPLQPPPRHPPTSAGMQTTYTPYVPRSRRGQTPAVVAAQTNGHAVPIIASSSRGGVTAVHPTTPQNDNKGREKELELSRARPSAALLSQVRALDSLPRLGALTTLDLRGNDLRTGVGYVGQVLKRNRTLKVLNLSENHIDVAGLGALAEALKYNTSLETLDLSKNPCCSPLLTGIHSLRTALSLNTTLKRLFLSSTLLTSPGAIALAEFLPEATALLHLDLTRNELDLAGVLALSRGLRGNTVIRCLDVDIPPGEEEFAGACRDILASCVRNTEEAERKSNTKTKTKALWGMIEESELAKKVGGLQEVQGDVLVRSKAALTLAQKQQLSKPKGEALCKELGEAIQKETREERLGELLETYDELHTLLPTLPATVNGHARPTLTLSGLGFPGWQSGLSGTSSPALSHLSGNSASSVYDSPVSMHSANSFHDDDEPSTPKIDKKGKAKAAPTPPVIEKVLSPTASLVSFLSPSPSSYSDDEDSETEEGRKRFPPVENVSAEELQEEMERASLEAGERSERDRSRSWVEEEGEIFRKGNVLLGPEEMEGEWEGDELRKELLEATVDRPPPRPIDIDPYSDLSSPAPSPSPSFSSPPGTPTIEYPQTPTPTATTPTVRPYISRTRSASSTSATSIMSLLSPGIASSPLASPIEAAGGTST